MTSASSRRRQSSAFSRPWRWLRRKRWWQQIALVLFLGACAPVPFILLLGVVQPPVTMVIVERAASRVIAGERPIWPERIIVGRNAISPNLRRAVLASEDDRFYLHSGIDFVEMQKALDRRRQGGRLRGASTITQQVAKNIFLWNGRSYVRKGLEMWLALWMDALLGKDRILDLYLNLAEWGPNAFGAEAGARAQFGKSAAKLSREEEARMAAILPAPRRWKATGSVASARSGTILERMQYPAPKELPPTQRRR